MSGPSEVARQRVGLELNQANMNDGVIEKIVQVGSTREIQQALNDLEHQDETTQLAQVAIESIIHQRF